MAQAIAQQSVTIRLLDDCADPQCVAVAGDLDDLLTSGRYTWPMSVLPLDATVDEWVSSLNTARKRATRARSLGYGMWPFERVDRPVEVNEINQSKPIRQGRPMDDSYLQHQTFSRVGDAACDRHRVSQYGLFDQHGRLVAYSVIHRSGELALISQILGHGDHLNDGVMHLLMVETYAAEQPDGGYLVYNRHDSGLDGLRRFKEWFRFRPMRVEWA